MTGKDNPVRVVAVRSGASPRLRGARSFVRTASEHDEAAFGLNFAFGVSVPIRLFPEQEPNFFERFIEKLSNFHENRDRRFQWLRALFASHAGTAGGWHD
jgi:hypothetical protein